MRVRSAHRRAAVLEDLDPAIALAELRGLRRPEVDDAAHISRRQLADADVVARREAQHPARALFTFSPQQAALDVCVGRVGTECGEVVREDERAGVVGVGLAVGARVARAQVARRVVCQRAARPVAIPCVPATGAACVPWRRGPIRRRGGCSAGAAATAARPPPRPGARSRRSWSCQSRTPAPASDTRRRYEVFGRPPRRVALVDDHQLAARHLPAPRAPRAANPSR